MIHRAKYINFLFFNINPANRYFVSKISGKYSCYFYSSAVNHLHHQKENELAHNILLDLPAYAQTTVDSRKLKVHTNNFQSKSKRKISSSNNFTKSLHSPVANIIQEQENHENDIQELFNLANYTASSFSDSELIHVLIKLIIFTPIKIDEKSRELLDLLSKECISRSKNWTINQMLLFADMWYNINVPVPVSYKFNDFAVKSLFLKLDSLNEYQFTQSFFYLNLGRLFKFKASQCFLEEKLESMVDRIGIEELGIISMGLFKTKNFIKDIRLLEKFVNILISNKKNISKLTLTAILKILKQSFSGISEHEQLCISVLKELESEVKYMDQFSLLQLASLGNHMNLYNMELLENIIELFIKNIQTARLKDLERFLFVIMNSRINLQDSLKVHQLIETELMNPERQNEIESHYESFLSCVYYLTSIGYYNSTLISESLKYRDIHKSKDLIRFRHLLELDLILDIEGPKDYQGDRLSKKLSCSLTNKCLPPMPSWTNLTVNAQEKQFLEVKNILIKIFREEFIHVTFILPFVSLPDILFCTDNLGNLQKFPHDMFNYSPEEIKFKPENKLKWHAIVSLNFKSYILRTNILRGIVARNTRLLRALGYNVIILDNKRMLHGTRGPIDPLLDVLKDAINDKWQLELRNHWNP